MKKHAAPSAEEPPAKRAKFLDDDDSDDDNGVALTDSFNINEDYAKRFEYNKKREEKQRLEEKYQNGFDDSDDDDSTSEEEDDAAELATADLDNEIFATLDAIKKKDPRVYDPNVTFYTPFDPDNADGAAQDGPKKEKPMYLKDYHRKQLLEGNAAADQEDGEDAPPRTYAQEQQDLKDNLVNQMHAATADDDDEQDEFLVKKPHAPTARPATARPAGPTKVDVAIADKDPETFLSNFMAARAWVPDETSRFKAFDSDDSEDDNRAEQFEHAYNLRFEDPKGSNEKLMTYGRDVAKYSVRRDDVSGRKKQREKEREKKEAEKSQRDEDKARLRKLKIEEVEEKVKKIKEAAGLKGDAIDLNEWANVLEQDFDDDAWEKEIQARFGDDYYADKEDRGRHLSEDDEDEDEGSKSKSKKPKKPKWDDDIDIKDLIPEFDDSEEQAKPVFTLSDNENPAENDDDDDDAMDVDMDAENDNTSNGKRKTKKDRLKEQADKKRVARKERMAIEELVDNQLAVDLPTANNPSVFRYRETSPDAFGLTARDILFADDTQLNQFAGLKKMAAFRDEEKKRRDKKKLGKKARLRQWRKETFGNEDGFAGGFKEFLEEKPGHDDDVQGGGGGKKRRGKKRKAAGAE